MLRIVFHFYLVEFIIHRIHIVYGELIQLADIMQGSSLIFQIVFRQGFNESSIDKIIE